MMRDWVKRGALVASGLACIGCEVWGVYDHTWAQQKTWNYVVVGSMVFIGLGAIAGPLAAEYARENGWTTLKWASWLAAPVVVLVVFMASVERTGGAADGAEAGRQQRKLNIEIAKKEEAEAEAKLVIDKTLVAQNCVGTTWGPICTKANEAQAKTEAKLNKARETLKNGGGSTTNSGAKRIVAILRFLTEEQVQLYQPMILPLGLAFFGNLFMALGIRSTKPVESKPGLWAGWRAPREAQKPSLEPVALEAAPTPAPKPPVTQPATKPVQVKKPAACPTIVANNSELALSLLPVLKKAPGKNASVIDLYKVDAALRREQGRKPIRHEEFGPEMDAMCRQAKFRMKKIKGVPHLVDVEVVTNMSQKLAAPA